MIKLIGRALAALLILLALASGANADYVGGLDANGDNYLSLRAGPGTDYPVLRQLGPDTLLVVFDSDGPWRHIQLEDGTQGWAHGDYIFPGLPPGYPVTVTDVSSIEGIEAIDVPPPTQDSLTPPDDQTVLIEPDEPDSSSTGGIARDIWRSPLSEVLFDGIETPLFLPHQAHGGDFATAARYADGALIVESPPGYGWGKVGLLSNDPLVWLDDFRDDAVVRVTFTLDPERTTGFGLALSQPGWGGVMGNDPGWPDVRFYWIRQPDGTSARAELHVDPHGENDYWKADLGPAAPTTITFVLKPGGVGIEFDGEPLAARNWPTLVDGIGLRVYAFSHAAAVDQPATMTLREIAVERHYPATLAQDGPAPGVARLPIETLFDGTSGSAFEPTEVAGGNYAAFAHLIGGALDIDVPAGNSWGKTGLISVAPLVVLDDRAYRTPLRIDLDVDPALTSTFVFALSGDKTPEMWPSHNTWISVSRRDDLGVVEWQINDGPYKDRIRRFPLSWFDTYWDGRLQFDFSDSLVCMRVPDSGPALCADQPVAIGMQLYATLLAHAPQEGAPTRLVIRRIARGLVTPPGLTARQRWSLIDDADFDADTFLSELGAALP